MMNWFKKKKSNEAVVIPPQKLGFFSTDLDFQGLTAIQKSQKLHEKLAITFQKGSENFKPVNEKGEAVQYAMDSEDVASVKSLMSYNVQGISEVQVGWYSSQGFIGYQMAALISQNWLIDKACTMPAKDSCRHGYEITVNDGTEVSPDILDYISKQDKKFLVKQNCVEFIKLGRVFGIRIALFIIKSNDPEYYTKPFNPDGVTAGSYVGISQIDPYWITPELSAEAASNPTDIHFYEPTWWRVNGKRIHRTHLIIMRNGDLPDILKPTYLYGGIPVPQKIAERVYAAERTANEAPMLAMSKRMTVLNVDVTQAVGNQDEFNARMNVWTQFMNNYGVKIVGENEKITQFDTSLAELDEVIMTQFQIVAAASDVPATKLLGTSPKGFNATGEFEESSYHEELESMQEHFLSPLVERHHLLLIRSHVAPKFGIAPFSTEINWNPVDSPTAAELAEINMKKAQTDSSYAASGAIDGVDIRNRLIADKDSGYNGLQPIDDSLIGESSESVESNVNE